MQNKEEEKEVEKPKVSLVDIATQAAERLEAGIKRQEELLRENQELVTKQILGGKSEAGTKEPEKKVETPKEYKDRVMRNQL